MGNKMFVQLFNVKNIHFGADSVSSLGEREQAACEGLCREVRAVLRDPCSPDQPCH